MTAAELKALRESTGLTQIAFVVQVLDCELTTTALSRYENGRSPIPAFTADAIRVRVQRFLDALEG